MSIKIEGLTKNEILELSDEHLNALVFTGEPIVLNAGTAEVLGSFRCDEQALSIELAQIDGGGEGVLVAMTVLAKTLARRRDCNTINWTVYAVDCANPNLKLRRVLERRGFEIQPVSSSRAYVLVETLTSESES